MSDETMPGPASRAITRKDLELVVRRAVQLATEQADAGDAISEDEVVRIGQEVGLAPQYVRQALFDLPVLQREQAPSLPARAMGACEVVGQRVLPGDAETVLRRVEQYLGVHEYLQVRRHHGGQALLVPAADAFSHVARAFTRPNRRFQLARASRVSVSTQPLEGGRARIRIEIDLDERRRSAFLGGAIGGFFAGLAVGGGLGTAGFFAGLALAGPVGAAAGAALLGLVGLAGGIVTGITLGRRTFRRHLGDASTEVEGLLDRLEAGERLEPPPSPLLRRLRDRFLR